MVADTTTLIRARAPAAQMSPTALAAILTGVGVVMLGLLVGLIVLLVRAVRTHKRLLADLEERGVVMAQVQRDAKRDSITRPRMVLKRTTILPFNSKSGWGALPSVETITPAEPASFPPHYAPPKPAGFVAKSSRLSWPFSARRPSGKAIRMRKIKVPTLSTVLESPKPSPLVPVLSGASSGEPMSPAKNQSQSRPSSDQSLLQHHPAFRHVLQEESMDTRPQQDPLRRSLTAKPVTKTETRVVPNRSKSLAEISPSAKAGEMSRPARPKLHVRSASMCSQSSGNAPVAPIPPLPLEIARIKTEARRRSLLSCSPSRVSISSYESAGSSILVTQSSPALPRSPNLRVQKVSRRDFQSSVVKGPRPIRDTLVLHGKNQRSQSSIRSSAARISLTSSPNYRSGTENRNSMLTNSSSMQSVSKVKTTESVPLSKVSSPSGSPLTVRSLTTPRRKSGSHVTAYGSPEERCRRSSVLQSVSGNTGPPTRQLSQASTQASSTRSSNGNPFQWDPTPLSSGKPSALKGSPSARKGHRRQNCVRISLAPTILGPPTAPSSPSAMRGIQEEPPNVRLEKRNSIGGLGFSNTRSLPRPPSASIFAPDVKLNATSVRASLTPSSPTLSMANCDIHGNEMSTHARYKQNQIDLDFAQPDRSMHVLPHLSSYESKRLSTGSIFSIPSFPSPCHGIGSRESIGAPQPPFALGQPLSAPTGTIERSSPFEIYTDSPYPRRKRPAVDEYDPEHPHLPYQTPACSPTRGGFSLPFSTILEESSTRSNRTMDYEQLRSEDSPSCSPKTILRPFHTSQDPSAFKLLAPDDALPEERVETIDPAVLSKHAFCTLNNGLDAAGGSIMKTPNSSRSSLAVPSSPGSARSMLEPLLEAAFPSSPPVQSEAEKPPPQCDSNPPDMSIQSSPSSMYSARPPSPSPSQLPPCSPRPAHAQLPTPAINFADMPMLSPTICGPRGSPPRPLRSSIQKLRRMNSDANEKPGKAERRYLHFGRKDSIALPGEESWLDELEGNDEEPWYEEKGRRLVSTTLNDWDEEATTIDLDAPPDENEKAQERGHDTDPVPKHHPSSPPQSPPQDPPPSPKSPVLDPAAQDRSSSTWDADASFLWRSTPPPPPPPPQQQQQPPNSSNKPKQHFNPLSSLPVCAPKQGRKRNFEVARDGDGDDGSNREQDGGAGNANGSEATSDGRERRRRERRTSTPARRRARRSALAFSTPNAGLGIRVQPPSGGSASEGVVGVGTPGSLYDADGFLRV